VLHYLLSLLYRHSILLAEILLKINNCSIMLSTDQYAIVVQKAEDIIAVLY
jgi:hypothetical protein